MAAFPKVTVEMALTSNPLDSSPTWTDVTEGLRSGHISRGRSHELDRMQAGTCSLTFRNDDDRFNPWNTASPYYGNLLSANQADVETDTTGFVVRANATLARTTSTAAHGSASLQCTAVASSAMQVGTPTGTSGIPVIAGKEYSAVISFKAMSGHTPDVKVLIDWYRSDGTYVSTSTSDSLTTNDSSFQQNFVTDNAPATAGYAAISGYTPLVAASEIIYMDKFGLFGGSGFPWSEGGRGGNLQPMTKLRVKAEWNLLTENQASVETDTTGLFARSNCTIARSTVRADDGAASLAVTVTANGNAQAGIGTGTSGVAVTPGKAYTAMVSIRSGGSARNCSVFIDFYNSSGVNVGFTQGNVISATTAFWQQSKVTMVAPATAAYASVSGFIASAGAGEVFYFDKFGIFPGGNFTAWSRGGPYYLFTGYVDSIEHSWPNSRYAETTIEASDLLKVLALAKAVKTTHNDAVVANSPRGYYHFNEKGEASAVNGLITAVDDSGNSRDGTIKGSPAGFQQDGALPAEIGGALDLGTDRTATGAGWVELPSTLISAGTGDFSIVGWFKPRSFNQAATKDRLWHCTAVGSQSFYIALLSDGTLNFVCQTSSDGGSLDSGTNPLTIGYYNHVAVVKSGTTGPTNWAIYINGVDVSNHAGETLVGSGNVSVTANSSLVGGYETGGVSQNAFDGVVDEFQFYGSALSSSDVTTLYDAGYGLAAPSLTGDKIVSLLDVVGVPTGDRSLDGGQFQMQPIKGQLYNQSPLPIILDYVDSEGYPSIFFVAGDGNAVFHDRAHSTPTATATFGDDQSSELNPRNGSGGDPAVRDELDLYTTVVCQAEGGAAQTATDATAATRYIDRTYSKTNLRNASDSDVATLAAAYLARKKSPAERVPKLTINPIGDPGNLWPQVLLRELNDRINYRRHSFPGDGQPLLLDVRIEGVEHEFGPGKWLTTWQLIPT